MSNEVKSQRVIQILLRLMDGEILSKKELAQEFQVDEKSIQNDIRSLNLSFAEQERQQYIEYDRTAGGYILKRKQIRTLTNSEILAVCKILLESRSMLCEEMFPILDKLVACCVSENNMRSIKKLLSNEKYHYIEPHHGQPILSGLWELGQAIQEHRVVELRYERLKNPHLVTRLVEPVGLMFSEYYFYLTAFLRDVDRQSEFENAHDLSPTIYRLDRIHDFRVLNERFRIPEKDRFEEGEFRKRIQFMYGGRLERVRFLYTGLSVEAVLDRLPTAQILSQSDDGWLIEAEVFGKGIYMWLRSQGDQIRLLSPVLQDDWKGA